MKTLIGKNNYLFLNNDSSQELNIHYNTEYKISDHKYDDKYNKNYYLVVFPDKSVVLKEYIDLNNNVLTNNVKNIDMTNTNRPGIRKYREILGDNLFDGYDYIKDESNIYYKTDTHMTLKGTFLVLKNFFNKFSIEFDNCDENIWDTIKLEETVCNSLAELCIGLGDLTWKINLGDLVLNDVTDVYIYSNQIHNLYTIQITDQIKIIDYEYNDLTKNFLGQNFSWDILSSHIIIKHNKNKLNKKIKKVIIFYDSFLINIADVLLNMFNEVYLIKNIYNNKIVLDLKPDYIFEFRVERFLC